jgi:hypothetical protein
MSSILETFYVLFESDSAEVKKGAKDAKKSTDDLNKSLKSTDQVSGKVGNEFVRMVSAAGGMLAAAFSVGAIVSATMAAANYADELGDLGDAVGANVSDLDVWGRAVKLSGGTAEGFQGTVKTMTAALADFATKGTSRAAPFFQDLGIKMVDAQGKARNFMDILPEIADSFQGLSKAESFGIGQKMGLDQGTIMLLQQGRREVDIMIAKQKELGAVTKEDAEIASNFNDQWDMTTMAFRSLFTQVGSSILPAMTAVMKVFERVGIFFRKNSDFITGILMALGAAVLYFVVPPLITAGIAAAVAFAPFLLMGAVIAGLAVAFALLYDDVMNFIDGNDSLIGQIVNDYPLLAEIVKALAGVVMWAWDLMAGLLQFLVELFMSPETAFENLVDNIGNALVRLEGLFPSLFATIGQLGDVFANVGAYVVSIWDGIIATITSGIEFVMNAINKVMSVAGKVGSFFGMGDTGNIQKGQDQLALASSSPISSQSSNSIATSTQSRSTSVSVGTVNVQTQATDADGISKSIGNSLNDQMKQASNSMDDGVLA